MERIDVWALIIFVITSVFYIGVVIYAKYFDRKGEFRDFVFSFHGKFLTALFILGMIVFLCAIIMW